MATLVTGVPDTRAVNGKPLSSDVTLTATDVGAEPSGTSSAAISQHEAKAGAHSIAGVNGLQAALDGKQSASPVLSAIAQATMGAFSNRNLLINGGFQVTQRGAIDKTFENSSEWVADRWRLFTNGPLYVRAFSIAGDGAGDTLGITGQNGATVNSFEFSQIIESYTSAGHVNAPLTVSFEWYCTTGHNINIKLNKPTAGIDNWSTYTAALPSQTITVNSGTSNVSVTFANVGDIRNGLGLNITVSNMQPSCIFKIKKVQLERGPVATPFEHRPYGDELSLCKRYYQSLHLRGWVNSPSGNLVVACVTYPVEMRATPTVTYGQVLRGSTAINEQPAALDNISNRSINAVRQGAVIECMAYLNAEL